jgi:hypothetical protein
MPPTAIPTALVGRTIAGRYGRRARSGSEKIRGSSLSHATVSWSHPGEPRVLHRLLPRWSTSLTRHRPRLVPPGHVRLQLASHLLLRPWHGWDSIRRGFWSICGRIVRGLAIRTDTCSLEAAALREPKSFPQRLTRCFCRAFQELYAYSPIGRGIGTLRLQIFVHTALF